MDFSVDFPTVLVVATFVTGVIWLLDAVIWAPRRRAQAQSGGTTGEGAEASVKEPIIVEYAKSFFPIILIVLLIRSFVAEPFRIPTGSMTPSLLVGDFILVNKFAYGLRLPVTNTKFIDAGSPQRGDTVVFRYPENPDIDFIKRVVGVPGDTVAYRDKVLYINGKMAEQQPVGTYVGKGSGADMNGAALKVENLDGVEHPILILRNRLDGDFEVQVQEGEYFVMGDNRDNSKDSRFWGMVPEKNLVGKAFLIWMNWDWKADGVIQWDRIGTIIK